MRSRQILIPLQALGALGLCLAMGWMIFVIAGFNPNPPTALDLQSRSTQDLSFASMNSTAAALALNMVAEFAPTGIVLPETQASMLLPTSTLSSAVIPIAGASLTPTPTSWFSGLFPPTREKEDDPTFTPVPPTSTPPPPPTSTRVPTRTPAPTSTVPPSPMPRTPTPVPPTTEVPPTEEPTDEPTATEPPTEEPTAQPPTDEPTATNEPVPQSTSPAAPYMDSILGWAINKASSSFKPAGCLFCGYIGNL